MLLTGPELIGIQPNDGALLQGGAANLRNVATVDLTFRFDENAVIDESTIATGVRIVRSGFDGGFQAASASSSFNTTGAVQVQFSAARLGNSENGISIVVTKTTTVSLTGRRSRWLAARFAPT